jgi:uroporphyrinogen-III synthase
MSKAGRLHGVGVLVTRPRDQAEALLEAIRSEGGMAIAFPALEIAPPADPHVLSTLIGRLREFDLLIFVSPTAVRQAWPLIVARHGDWPHGFSLAAIGQGSARALKEHGAKHVLVPESGSDSESLLALPKLQDMAGKRVLIFRGEGGREVLADVLRRRGAAVDYAECYRRQRPSLDPRPILGLWAAGGIQAVTVTSSEILTNLIELLGPDGLVWLRATPLFVIHERIAAAAHQHGLEQVFVTMSGDEGLMAALMERFSPHE